MPRPENSSHTGEKAATYITLPEISRTPEVDFRLKVAVLTISGKGSCGNTSFADGLANLYGVPEDRVYHAGRILREATDAGNTVEYIQRNLDVDKAINDRIRELIRTATPENPIIIEAKLGGAILRDEEQIARDTGVTLPGPRLSIVKVASQEKRAEIARGKKGNEKLSISDLRRLSQARDRKDNIQWMKAEDRLSRYKNILDKNAVDNEGFPVYDLIVDSTHSTLEDDVRRAHEYFRVKQIIERISHMPSDN